jgi:hypothetical protein
MINWKRVAQERLARIRELEKMLDLSNNELLRELERAIMIDLHARGLAGTDDARPRAAAIAATVMERLRRE